jgi:hypothetical protein
MVRSEKNVTTQVGDHSVFESITATLRGVVRGTSQNPRTGISQAPAQKESKEEGGPFDVSDRKDVLIVPVFLPGGHQAYPVETRRRIRYALISALTTCGYRAEDRDHLRFARIELNGLLATDKPLVVPYEVFSADVSDRFYDPDDFVPYLTVLVCWIDGAVVRGRPLGVACQLVEDMLKPAGYSTKRLHWALRMIGPANTDGLLTMAQEYDSFPETRDRLEELSHLRPTLYSPRATVHIESLKRREDELLGGKSIVDILTRFINAGEMNVIRTIGTDKELAVELKRELRLRGKWPEEVPIDKIDRSNIASAECIVLVTERDSLYGRSFPNAFEQNWNVGHDFLGTVDGHRWQGKSTSGNVALTLEFGKRDKGGAAERVVCSVALDHDKICCEAKRIPTRSRRSSNATPSSLVTHGAWRLYQAGEYRGKVVLASDLERASWEVPKPLVVYKYLKGIDGTLAENQGKDDPSKREQDLPEVNLGYEASGNNQFDYVRRMERRLATLHDHLKRQGGGIRAIGVVGSDVYDKLIILRALAKRFPHASFFTTDLDADLSRPSELHYTQNLIVASHYGLALHPSLQRDVPPFRKSYQTATFLSALHALEDSRLKAILPLDEIKSLWCAIQPTSLRIMQSNGSTEVSEEWTSDHFFVQLRSRPATDVALRVRSSDETEVSVSPRRLVFPLSNWSQSKKVTVKGVDDEFEDGTKAVTVTVGEGNDAQRVIVNNRDNDLSGLTIHETCGNTMVSADGLSDSFYVSLNSPLPTDLRLLIESTNKKLLSVNPTELTFDALTWKTRQEVSVRGLQHNAAGDTRRDSTAANEAVSGPKEQVRRVGLVIKPAPHVAGYVEPYHELLVEVLPKTSGRLFWIRDNRPLPWKYHVDEGYWTREGENFDHHERTSLSLFLLSKPDADIELTLHSLGTGRLAIGPSTLTFSENLWQCPRRFELQFSDVSLGGAAARPDSRPDSCKSRAREFVLEARTSEKSQRVKVLTKPGGNRLRPLVFEISRFGPYQLTTTGGPLPVTPAIAIQRDDAMPSATATIHPPSPRTVNNYRWRIWMTIAVVIFVALLAANSIGLRDKLLMYTIRVLRFVRDAASYPFKIRTFPIGPREPIASRLPPPPRRSDFVAFLIVLLSIGSIAALVIITIRDHSHPDGEPFELFLGISVWPSIWMRFAIFLTSCVFIGKAFSDLSKREIDVVKNELRLNKQQCDRYDNYSKMVRWFPTTAMLSQLCSLRDAATKSPGDVKQIRWVVSRYHVRGRFRRSIFRVLFLSLLLVGLACSLFFIDQFPNVPYRGDTARYLHFATLFLSVLLMIVLVCVVSDATYQCHRMVKEFRDERRCIWPQAAVEHASRQRGCLRVDWMNQLLSTKYLALQTNVVGRLLKYPFIALFLMILARHPITDRWNIPFALLILFGIMFSMLIVHSMVLRRGANRARRTFLSQLSDQLCAVRSEPASEQRDAAAKQLEMIIDEIESEKQGAFRPITDDYVFKALAIPFTGTGGLLVLDQLLT